MHISGANQIIMAVCLLIFFKAHYSCFFPVDSSSTHTPLVFRTPAWFKVDPTRNQKSVKQGLGCFFFIISCMLVGGCVHQIAKCIKRPDLILFSLCYHSQISLFWFSHFPCNWGRLQYRSLPRGSARAFTGVQTSHFSHPTPFITCSYILTHIP